MTAVPTAPRARIVEAAAHLLATGGRDAVTTRAVAAGAGVQAPTIYRLFGDKDGLLDAVTEYGFQAYLARKAVRSTTGDPVDDLRAGWDLHVGFGLANPALYALMYGDPRPDSPSAAAVEAEHMLRGHIRRVAEAGRLRVGEEQAAHLFHAAACGTVLTLLGLVEEQRNPALSHLARDAALTAITIDAPVLETPGPVGAAVALRAVLDGVAALTAGERAVMREWLDRVAAG
jgi:AcrR family transcriptional regulator